MTINNNLPNELVNNIILDYLTVYDNKNININIENKRKNIINSSITKIKHLFNPYMIKRRYDINYYEDSYYIPHSYWKLYYPLYKRKYFLKLVIKQSNLHNKELIISIYKRYLKKS